MVFTSPTFRIIVSPRQPTDPTWKKLIQIDDMTQEFGTLDLREMKDVRELRDILSQVLEKVDGGEA